MKPRPTGRSVRLPHKRYFPETKTNENSQFKDVRSTGRKKDRRRQTNFAAISGGADSAIRKTKPATTADRPATTEDIRRAGAEFTFGSWRSRGFCFPQIRIHPTTATRFVQPSCTRRVCAGGSQKFLLEQTQIHALVSGFRRRDHRRLIGQTESRRRERI